jgi:hypothetical protein
VRYNISEGPDTQGVSDRNAAVQNTCVKLQEEVKD